MTDPFDSFANNPFDLFGPPSSGNRNQQQQQQQQQQQGWQQNARAAMANGSTVWKNSVVNSKAARGNNNNNQSALSFTHPSLRSPSSGSLNNSNEVKHDIAKRVVPYSGPITTLESNWDPWLFIANSSSPPSLWRNGGNCMTYLVVGANQGCILPGGVESVLKWGKTNNNKNLLGDGNTADLSGFDALSINDGGGGGSMQDFNDSANGTNAFNNNNNNNNNSNYDGASSNRRSSSSGGVGGLGFLKSGFKKAQGAIVNSVTTMAIRADGGKNPDWVCASLYYRTAQNMASVNALIASGMGMPMSDELGDVCLSRTEWVPLPSSSSLGDNTSDAVAKGLSFSVPLSVPDLGFLEAAASGGAGGSMNENVEACGVRLTVRLYLRSGATLLKAAKREYSIGESTILYSNIIQLASGQKQQQHQQQQQQQPSLHGTNSANGLLHSGTINLPFTSGILAETSSFSSNTTAGDAPAALNIVATPRIKFNNPCTLGWSLTDPTTIAPTRPLSWLQMFQLPLDQGYAFPLVRHHELLNNSQQQQQYNAASHAILIANERAVESAVTLPLATAVARLLSAAAVQSQQIASLSAERTFRREAITTYAITKDMDDFKADSIVEAALKDGCAEVEIGLVALVVLGNNGAVMGGNLSGSGGLEGVPFVRTSLSFQRHDTIFEEALALGSAPLLDEPSGRAYINNPAAGLGPKEAITTRFCPRILTGQPDNDEDATLLPGVLGTKPNGKYVGNVRLEALVGQPGANSDIMIGIGGDTTNLYNGASGGGVKIEGLFELEYYLDPQINPTGGKLPVTVPAIDAATGKRIGSFLLLMRVKTQHNQQIRDPLPSASSGLLSVMGLDVLSDDMGLAPYYDYDTPSTAQETSTAAGIRRRQIATMGSFLTPQFLRHQADVVRNNDAVLLSERCDEYNNAILAGISPDAKFEDETGVELFKRRNPRPFRPSNSRGDALLAGIGFNVHVQSLSLNILQESSPAMPAAVHHSVTHGAPADHARGFGIQGSDGSKTFDSVGDAASNNLARGGLRRLEARRSEIAIELESNVSGLINSVGEYFKSRAQAAAIMQQAGIRPSRHVAPNNRLISFYRSKTVECAQRLHSLTWDIAVRRGNCFSQALGIAMTSYLSSLSDGGPAWRGYANIWIRHGYLITFEGLLSAVGKELGMIEDASVAVGMLRSTYVVLLPDDGNSSVPANGCQRVPVPHSPYVRWVHLTSNGYGSKSHYRLEIGLDPSYYQSRVPEQLKGGTTVRFFPVLYQMGVDIRQWGANAGRNVTSQIKDRSKAGGTMQSDFGDGPDGAVDASVDFGGGLIDDGDEDDEGGVPDTDNEILMALNVEGYRKMNAYAHAVNPTTRGVSAASSPVPAFSSYEHAQIQPLPPHPFLASLSDAIKTSAGKMEHGVLDKAATACQRLGGGATVFCKSGKDRTAMQVTFKQAQFLQRFMDKKTSTALEDTPISYDSVFENATLMRIHGTRVPICEKNAGEAKYAFNPLQAKFMPEMLKPPPITLAGFLKKPET